WTGRDGRFFRVGGPAVILAGIAVIAATLLRGSSNSGIPNPGAWDRFSTGDGVCSAEFPQAPQLEQKMVSDAKMDTLKVYLKGPDAYYALNFSDVPPGILEATIEQRLSQIRYNLT